MKEVAVYEAKTRLSELLAEVEQGEQVTITRRGLPIARLVSASSASGSPRPSTACASSAKAWCWKATRAS